MNREQLEQIALSPRTQREFPYLAATLNNANRARFLARWYFVRDDVDMGLVYLREEKRILSRNGIQERRNG